MAKEIDVAGKSRIYIGSAEALLSKLLPAKRIIVITDRNIDRTHRTLLAPFETIFIGQGEQAKSLTTVEEVYGRLIKLGADRQTFILGVGGGIVTDVAGFVASTYMRGVEFGFVTTTLLGAVDASVGGKNGVNVGGFKNMAGVFSQPKFVVCDAKLLATLPPREFRAGLAEVIKSAILGDAELFAMLEKSSFEELCKGGELLEEVICHCIEVKAKVVTEDEREGGRRRILNLGHTIGHAIEKCSSKMLHGEAVAVGLYHIALTARAQGLLSEEDCSRILALIEQYGFETALPVEKRQIIKAIEGDKKRSGNTIYLILPCGIGDVVERVVGLKELKGLLDDKG